LVDAGSIIRKKRVLSGVAEVSLQFDGQVYEDRLVLIRGDLTDVSYGAKNEMVSFTIEDPKETTDQLFPSFIINGDSFPTAPVNSYGRTLAVVVPKFRNISGAFVSSSVTAPQVAVAHGHITIGSVYVDGVPYSKTSSVFPWSQQHYMNREQEPYTAVLFTNGTGTFSGTGDEQVYANLTDGPTNGVVKAS
jgi:hypothetical protein